jgi:hypothetical protein
LIAAGLPLGAPGARAAEPATYLAGAAGVDITPPTLTSDPNGTYLVTCPGAWPGARTFDQDEPYVDVNTNGHWDVGSGSGPSEPYCDRNANHRYDGIYVAGGVNHAAGRVNDDIYARAFAVSDGTKTVVVSSVDAIGLFQDDIERARSLAEQALAARGTLPASVSIFVSATHDESSPDTLGLWGPAPDDSAPSGTTSGVDDYYMDFLVGRMADSIVRAVEDLRPASLRIVETTAPGIDPSFKQWPTTNKKDPDSANPSPTQSGRIDVWNPKVRILQAVDAATDATIFTTVGYDAHVQNLGHSDNALWSRAISADWVQFLAQDVEAQQGGLAVYLQGTNGSVETPQVPGRTASPEGTIERSQDIGRELASVANSAISDANPLPFGQVRGVRQTFQVPLQNSLFSAAFAAGLFPHKHVEPAPPQGPYPLLETEVGLAQIGPLELSANPGEAFPLLLKGSHWGRNEVCQSRPNPPIPAWYSGATYRWDMGLTDDMIGYELPAWAWDESPAVYSNADDPCSTNDSREGGHRHALESESLGPVAGNKVAGHLTALVRAFDGPHANRIRRGRYLFDDGTISRRPYEAPWDPAAATVPPDRHAVGMVYVKNNGGIRVVALPGYDHVGEYTVDVHGSFVDFDGDAQIEADQLTRGMRPTGRAVVFLDVFANLNL